MRKGLRLALVFFLFGILLPATATSAPTHAVSASSTESCLEYPRNPVLNASEGYTYNTSTGTWFAYNNTYQEPTVMGTAGGFRMWYAGYLGGVQGIYTATSKDGGNWTVDSTPVLMSGPNGSWDHSALFAPSVLYNGTGYIMYFRASSGSIYSRSIGLAFSSDGVHWREYANNPVLKPGPSAYDSNWIYSADVILWNNSYYMWYAGQEPIPKNQSQIWYFSAIDLATSKDGVHWSKYAGNPVFLGAPDEIQYTTVNVGHPDVLKVGGALAMLYDDGQSVRYAVSGDGLHWTPVSGDLVNASQAYWKSDGVVGPAGLLSGTKLTLWYSGSSPVKSSSSSYIEGIGLATCNLAFAVVSTTTTATLTSTFTTTHETTLFSTTTATITSTIETTLVSTTTVSELATAVPWLAGTTSAGAILALALLYLLVRRRPR